MSKRTFRPAFTLVEVMVVVGIIALLTALLLTVTPRIYRAVYGARTQAQLAALATAIQTYHADFNSYPGPLGNNQIGYNLDSHSTQDGSSLPYIVSGGTSYPLKGINAASNLNTGNITESENLVLGLLGALRVQTNSNSPPGVTGFVYDPTLIFPDGQTASPTGAASLNVNNPRQQQAYIQVKTGDLFVPNYSVNNGCFTDSAGRGGSDSCIPEFLDKYADPLPILFYRPNVGAKAIVGNRNYDDGGAALMDTDPGGYGQVVAVVPQYDIDQNLGYTSSTIGTNAANPLSYHGLQGVGNANLTDPIMTGGAPTNGGGKKGANGIAFLRDPNYLILGPNNPGNYDPYATNTHNGFGRQKDGFLLISAGPDRLYGVPTDLIYPGTVSVSN